MFQQFIAFIKGSYLPQKLLKQYLCCGCIWITTSPVWPSVGGCDRECIVGSVLAVSAHADEGNELLKHVAVKFGMHQ
jgi:hypothetical protein